MSAISRDEVAHLAALARIELQPDELETMAEQLQQILTSVATVQQAAGPDVPATSHPVPLVNVTRPDVPRPGLTQEQALSGAPSAQDGRFQVPRILEED